MPNATISSKSRLYVDIQRRKGDKWVSQGVEALDSETKVDFKGQCRLVLMEEGVEINKPRKAAK